MPSAVIAESAGVDDYARSPHILSLHRVASILIIDGPRELLPVCAAVCGSRGNISLLLALPALTGSVLYHHGDNEWS